MKLLRRFLHWLRPRMPFINLGLALLAYLANRYFIQGFCQPVAWAAWVVAISTSAFLAWPWLKRAPKLQYPLAFLLGVQFTVCVYCVVFVGPGLLLATLLLGFLLFPLLLWVPVVFAVQAANRVLVSQLPGIRWAFGLGVVALLPVQAWAWQQYRQVAAAVATLPPSQHQQAESLLRVVPRSYMAERLAGQLFKYHASAEMIYDGWRPPLHDPLVNVCMWANAATGYTAPLTIGELNIQAAFYHQLFPNEPVKMDCGCNVGGDGYYAWKPGVTDGWGQPLSGDSRSRY